MTAPPERVFDAQEILRVLVAHSVDFVIIGGIAVQAHGYIRWTKDLDVIVRPSTLNFTRLSEALQELEAELRGSGTLKLADPHQLRRVPLIPVMTTAGPLDVVNVEHVAGAPRSYDGLRQAALVIELFGIRGGRGGSLRSHPDEACRWARARSRGHRSAHTQA